MTSKELIELCREYENSDSVRRRKEIWDSVEYATLMVFRNLCRRLDGYAEQHNVSLELPAECYFSWDCSHDYLPCDDPDGPLNSPGVTVTYEMANGQESVLTIPYKYFDCTNDDWEKMLEEKNAKALSILKANLKIEKDLKDTEDEYGDDCHMVTPKKFFSENCEDETEKSRQPPKEAKTPDRPCATVSHFEVLARIEAMRDQVEEMGRQLTEFEKTLDMLNFDITIYAPYDNGLTESNSINEDK